MIKNEIINKMRAHNYESVLSEGPTAWVESEYDADILFSIIIAAYQLKNLI
jgi:hypothetical protein